MAKATGNYITWGNTTDAEFRTWVAEFIAQMLAIGWAQSSDTGQINTSTVLKPTGTAVMMGYAMFTPNDGLSDFKFKVNFGAGNHGQLQAGMYVQVGWETDGAGNFIGIQNTSDTYMIVGYDGNAIFKDRALWCKSGPAFFFNWEEAGTSNTIGRCMMVDRMRTAAGVARADGVAFMCSSNSTLQTYNATLNVTATPGFIEAVQKTGGRFGAVYSNGRLPYGAVPYHAGPWGRGSFPGYAPLVPWDGPGSQPIIACVITSWNEAQSGNVNGGGTLHRVKMFGTEHVYRSTRMRADSSNFGAILSIWE